MNNGIRLTPSMIKNLAEGYLAGKTTTQLAEEYDISKATICRALRKEGIEPERKDNLFQVKEYTAEEKESICVDYRAGLKVGELRKKHSDSYEQIVKILEEAGIYKRKDSKKLNVLNAAKYIKVGEHTVKKFISADEAVEICEKYQAGPQTKSELAEEYDVHVDTITAVLNKANIGTKKYLADETIDAICAEYAAGSVSLAELAKIYEKNTETIRYWLTKRGLLAKTEVPATVVGSIEPTPSKALNRANLRQAAREEGKRSLETLIAIRDSEAETGRTRIAAAIAIWERGYGKPGEVAEDDKAEETSLTSKILKMVPQNLVKKKEEN